ncbi:MAG: polymer-forming cytoskeletal protein [Alphaproteobacteria bacterium]|nr:polymer-forming cytoskeletal protein [Alphaproteobacteria bacterium]
MSQENATQSPVAARGSAPVEQAARTVTPANPVPATARRSLDLPHGNSRRSERSSEHGERKLIVGKGLSLAGEITACDVLVVEGKVEAKLTDGKMLEITESGQFRGSVEIENADIAGRYDGELTVHGRLTLRGTGRISGMVKYGELEVSAGGQIIGELQVVGENIQAPSGKGSNFRHAAKFAALTDDEEEIAQPARRAGNA